MVSHIGNVYKDEMEMVRVVISADDKLLHVAIERSHPPTPDKIEGIR